MQFNKKHSISKHLAKSILLLSMLLLCFVADAQKSLDSVKRSSQILILDNDYGEYIKNDTSSVNKLIGNVKLLHGSDTLYCDSAYFYTQRNGVEAFGDVLIKQLDGTEASADYMRYNGKTKVVFMQAKGMNDVQLYDGKTNTLWSKEIDYNLFTKVGRYRQHGFLQTEKTVLESNTGEYNLRSKDARFKGNVIVTDPEYRAVSEDLGYNTDTKVARFFAPSVVTNDKSILQTSNGVYDTKNRTSHFVDRSSVLNEAQYIEGDTLDYNRNTGFAFAKGNVIAIDTGMKSILYCGYAQYNEIHKTLLAYDKPLMRKSNGTDSMFIKADTFYTAPDPTKAKTLSAQDSLQQTANDLRSGIGADSTVLHVVDSNISKLDSLGKMPIPVIDTNSLIMDDSFDMMVPLRDSALSLIPADYKNDALKIPDAARQLKDTLIKEAIPDLTKDVLKPETDSLNSPKELSSSLLNLKGKMDEIVYNKGSVENQRASANASDTAKLTSSAIRLKNLDSASLTYHNTPQEPDTSGPHYFVGYHHVLIYSDSVQGKCDSIRYSEVDSMLRMYVNPVLWPKGGEMLGDYIYMRMDSSKLKQIIIPKNAIMINRSGPEQAGMYDQIQGNSINAYLTNNKMDSLIAQPEASSIYFIKDDDSAYVGSSEGKAETIKVLFKNEEIDKIYYLKDVDQKSTPMKDVDPSALRLGRYNWRESERPKTLLEFLNGTTLPHAPQLLDLPQIIEPDDGEENKTDSIKVETKLKTKKPE
jgi:lipopolysaccharide export system protein LptA